MRVLRIILSDFAGLVRVFGLGLALRWLLAVVRTLPECRRRGELRPADIAVGEGPFRARRGRARARLVGKRIIGSAREVWVRDVYLDGGFLSIPPGARVVDLGCNRGIFTLLALGHHADVTVVGVEADPTWLDVYRRGLEVNGWTDRVTLIEAFVGGTTGFQERLREREGDASVPTMSVSELIESCALTRIDFLKIDIEGSEFDLLTPDSPLLAITDQLAVELHREAGDPEVVIAMLEGLGFATHISHAAPNDVVLLAKRPDKAQSSGQR